MSNPTDTNQASLFELCKEVAKRTDWLCDEDESDFYFYWEANEGGDFSIRYRNECPYYSKDEYYPLYTSDYLLEKLQQLANTDRNQLHLFTDTNNGYSAKMTISGGSYGEEDYHWYEISDGYGHRTPVLALLKLTIALSEAGELK